MSLGVTDSGKKESRTMLSNDVEVIRELSDKVKAALEPLGIKAGVVIASHRARAGRPQEFQSDHFIDIHAEQCGPAERVEFSRIMEIEEVRRRTLQAVAEDFCKRATAALGDIDLN
jgi:hypothetical protein